MANFKRIINFALLDLNRNKGVSLAAVFVLVITISLITGLLFFQGVSQYFISQLQDKIDITAYFKEDAIEEDILKVKDEISQIPEVKDVEYVSREKALEVFTERHKNNPVFLNALEEVGQNPFLPSLNIKTKGTTEKYAQVSEVLESETFSPFIKKVDFSQKRDTIDRLFSITSSINFFSLILGVILVIVAVLVVFNTVKLAVEASKDEITTMRVVGAPDWFIKGPFIVQGALYGIIAFVICFVLSLVLSYFLASKLEIVLSGFNSFQYFLSHFWIFALAQLGSGVVLGVLSSLIVVRKYLDV